jgi:hypothetical protein
MNNRPVEAPFRLRRVPCELWSMARMVVQLRADDQTIRRWVREDRLPRPAIRRGGRPLWDPADVEEFRRARLRRIS